MSKTMPSPVIVVYSKTGHSWRAAEQLGDALGVAPFEITTPLYRWPLLGWMRAARAGMTGKTAPLDQKIDLPNDGLVVLVGPVWAGGPAAPLNTVIDALKSGSQRVCAILTCGDSKEDASPIQSIETRLGRPLEVALVLSNEALETPDATVRIEAFASLCRPAIQDAS